MYRLLFLMAALILIVGCGKKRDSEKTPSDSSPGAGPSTAGSSGAGGMPIAALPKVVPRAKFNRPGKPGIMMDVPVQLSDDGRTLALSYLSDKTGNVIQVWDIATAPKLVAEFKGFAFALSPSGKFLLVSSRSNPNENECGRVFELASKNEISTLPTYFTHGFFRDDGTVVATSRSHNFPVATKGKVTVWDVARNADAGSFEIPDNRFVTALPAKGGSEIWLFLSNNKFEVERYDVVGRKLVQTVKPENDQQMPFSSAGVYQSIAPDASVFTSNASRPRIYDATTGRVVGKIPDQIWSSPTGFLPGGSRYLARGNKKIGLTEANHLVYDWKAQKGLAILIGHSSGTSGAIAAASRDGTTLVSVSPSGEALVFDISSAK